MTYHTNRKDIRDLWPRLNPKKIRPIQRPLKRLRLKTRAPRFYLKGYGSSHVGCKRKANEDSFWMVPRNNLWIVADGMGGHAGGQTASTIAVQQMAHSTVQLLFKAEESNQKVDIAKILTQATAAVNEEVTRHSNLNPTLMSMGSTLTALLAYGDYAYLAHIGDSRAYLIRDERLIQITEDHSYVQELVNFGYITVDQALIHHRRNLILKSISRNSDTLDIAPDIAAVPMQEGDRFLLCSDGLIEHVRDDEILRTVLENRSMHVSTTLINKVNSRDYATSSGVGTDNTTIVVVEVGKKKKSHTKR
jgi:PPM family protein phosphatase